MPTALIIPAKPLAPGKRIISNIYDRRRHDDNAERRPRTALRSVESSEQMRTLVVVGLIAT